MNSLAYNTTFLFTYIKMSTAQAQANTDMHTINRVKTEEKQGD